MVQGGGHARSRPGGGQDQRAVPRLLLLFDGGCDADAAFLSRAIRITGDTAAVMALHNSPEAAELTLA